MSKNLLLKIFANPMISNQSNRIAIGTAQFTNQYGITNTHGVTEQEDVNKILKCALDNGVKFLDTAIGYGQSEKSIGFSKLGGFKCISKLPTLPKDIISSEIDEWIKNNILQSIKNLGVEKLFAFLLHNVNDLNGPYAKKIYDVLNESKEKNLIEYVGYSLYNPDELDQHFDNYKPDIVQIPYNVFDQRFSETGWISRLHNEGVIIHARSIFLQGLLLLPMEKLPKYFLGWREHFKKWNTFLNNNNVTPLEACISYVLMNEKVDQLIIGVENVTQIKEIIRIIKNNCFYVSENFAINDTNLINPSKWKSI